MRSWRLSQPAYGMLAEQRKQLSRWAMSAGKGPALLELGKLAPPELEAGGDSPDYSVEGDSSPDYSSLREAVNAPADSSPPPLVTPAQPAAREVGFRSGAPRGWPLEQRRCLPASQDGPNLEAA